MNKDLKINPKLEINNNNEEENIKGISIKKSKINGPVSLQIVDSKSTSEEKIQALIEENRELRNFISEVKIASLKENFTNIDFIGKLYVDQVKDFQKEKIYPILKEINTFKSFVRFETIHEGYIIYRFVINLSEQDSEKLLEKIYSVIK